MPYEVRFGRSLPTGRDRPQVHVWLRAPRKKARAGVRCRPTAHSARAYVSGRQSTFCAVTKKTTAARATFSNGVPLPKSRERYSSDLWCRATKKNSRSVTAEALPKLPGSASAEQFGPSLRKGLRDGPQVRYRETPGKRRGCTFSVGVPLPKNRERYSSDHTARRQQKKAAASRASAHPKNRERTGGAENRSTGKRRVKSPLVGRERHAARPLQKGNGRAAGTRLSRATICWRITSQFDSLLLRARPHEALGQVAAFGTADKAPYQPWLFVMQAAKKSSLPAKNLPSLR